MAKRQLYTGHFRENQSIFRQVSFPAVSEAGGVFALVDCANGSNLEFDHKVLHTVPVVFEGEGWFNALLELSHLIYGLISNKPFQEASLKDVIWQLNHLHTDDPLQGFVPWISRSRDMALWLKVDTINYHCKLPFSNVSHFVLKELLHYKYSANPNKRFAFYYCMALWVQAPVWWQSCESIMGKQYQVPLTFFKQPKPWFRLYDTQNWLQELANQNLGEDVEKHSQVIFDCLEHFWNGLLNAQPNKH